VALDRNAADGSRFEERGVSSFGVGDDRNGWGGSAYRRSSGKGTERSSDPVFEASAPGMPLYVRLTNPGRAGHGEGHGG
jgi:hypothetical protein